MNLEEVAEASMGPTKAFCKFFTIFLHARAVQAEHLEYYFIVILVRGSLTSTLLLQSMEAVGKIPHILYVTVHALLALGNLDTSTSSLEAREWGLAATFAVKCGFFRAPSFRTSSQFFGR